MIDTQDPVHMKLIANSKNLPGISRDKWESECEKIGIEAVRLKFEQNAKPREMLLNTHDKYLAESAPKDSLWGIGLNRNDTEIVQKRGSWGRNYHGKNLVNVRGELSERHQTMSNIEGAKRTF